MTNEDDENCWNTNICRFHVKEILNDKVRDHSHLTGKYRGPAHNVCTLMLHRNEVISYQFYLTTLAIMVAIYF